MPRFTIAIRPDGRAILAYDRLLEDAERERLVAQVHDWLDTGQVLIIEDCTVTQISELEIDFAPVDPVGLPPADPALIGSIS